MEYVILIGRDGDGDVEVHVDVDVCIRTQGGCQM